MSLNKTIEQHLDIRNREIWKPFLGNLCLVIVLFCLGICIGLFIRQAKTVEKEMLTRARSHVNSLTLTRHWNSLHGGVWVEKKAPEQWSPRDITTDDGKVFTPKSPALMTREMAQLAREFGNYTFRVTSLAPINPINAPDAFETQALLAFQTGVTEFHTKEKKGGATYFRYMAPLTADQSCRRCHGNGNAGIPQGGISISFDVSQTEKSLQTTSFYILLSGLATLAILFAIIYLLVRKLILRLRGALETIQIMATTDELTGLANRRHFFNRFNDEARLSIRHGHTLSLIILDLDHFKRLNDQHGHQAGDLALKSIGKLLREVCRRTDIISRYGGEEFIVVLPQTDAAGTLALAEKLRQRIAELEITVNERTSLRLTASFGVITSTAEQLKAMANCCDKMIQLADLTLYRAKGNGRNRVEIFTV